MAFFLFLLINATLFIRPAEVVPALLGTNIYEALNILCLAVALPDILNYFTRRPLSEQPVTLCVLGLMVAVPLAHVSRLDLDQAWATGFLFFKVVVYYVFLVSIVNTPSRLRQFVLWTATFCAAMVLVALLRYHDILEIQMPAAPPAAPKPGQEIRPGHEAETFIVERAWDPERRQLVDVRRMVGTGIFRDPNDLCLAIALAVPLCLFGLMDPRLGAGRLLFVPTLVLFAVALGHTQSRGGFLAVCAGLLTLFQARYGWRKCLALGALTLPLLVVLFAGRATTISTTQGTGQDRIQLWSDWMDQFRSAPLLGVGPLNNEQLKMALVAHNSFLQGFADMGLVGGTLFIGAYFFALLTLRRAAGVPTVSPEMTSLRPFLFAALIGCSVSLLTLTLTYLTPTYIILGLASAYAGVAPAPRAAPLLRCSLSLVQRLALVSLAYLTGMYVFVRVFRA